MFTIYLRQTFKKTSGFPSDVFISVKFIIMNFIIDSVFNCSFILVLANIMDVDVMIVVLSIFLAGVVAIASDDVTHHCHDQLHGACPTYSIGFRAVFPYNGANIDITQNKESIDTEFDFDLHIDSGYIVADDPSNEVYAPVDTVESWYV